MNKLVSVFIERLENGNGTYIILETFTYLVVQIE